MLDRELIDNIRPLPESIKPRKAVFDRNYVRKRDGPNVKKDKSKMELAEQVRADIREFKKSSGASRLIMIWCGSTEIFLRPCAAHQSEKAFEKGLEQQDLFIQSMKLKNTLTHLKGEAVITHPGLEYYD